MKQVNFKGVKPGAIEDRMMHVSAESRDELDDTVDMHLLDGWREKSRTVSHDGTFMATLIRSR